jgi:hypothetical protein
MMFRRSGAPLRWMGLLIVVLAGASSSSAAQGSAAAATSAPPQSAAPLVAFVTARRQQEQQRQPRPGEREAVASEAHARAVSRIIGRAPPLLAGRKKGPPPAFAGSALNAKGPQRKRRQRRGDSDSDDSDEAPGDYADPSADDPASDLPDFVLPEEDDDDGSASSTGGDYAPQAAASGAATGTTSRPKKAAASGAAAPATPVEAKSIKELLGDRALERKMVFDDEAPEKAERGEELPDLAQLAASATTKGSSKRQEQAARKAALQQAAAASSSSDQGEGITEVLKGVASKLPILEVTNDNGEVTPQKLLEAGTWLGIFLLVAWEFYINSPLFDRAAPMAPVVY